MIAWIHRFLTPAWIMVALLSTAADESTGYRVVPDWPSLPDGIGLGVRGDEIDLPKGAYVAAVGGLDVDSHNHIFVFLRSDPPIVCIDGRSGKLIASWGTGLFINAHALEIDHEDNVWVTDTGRHQVLKFSHEGELLLSVGEEGVAGLDETHFNQPTDVAVAPNGEFYVSDGYGNNRVVRFSPEGKFISDWGERGSAPGQFDLPHGIARDAGGRLYVADRTNGRIQVFDADGQFLHLWQSEALGRPWSVDIGADGHLYVIDGGDLEPTPLRPVHPDRPVLRKLDLEGKIVARWGSFGAARGQLDVGHAIAIGPDGAVYTGEALNQVRVQKFVWQ